MRRAREIVPALRERAQAAEDARVLIRENEQLLHETGLFRFHQPKTFGGMELRFRRDLRHSRPRSRAAARRPRGTSAISRLHHWMLGYYEPETQHEVWDANPDALIASSIALAAGRGRKVDGGFVVTGRWPFSSGVDNSDWNMLAVTVYDGDKAVDSRLCLVPKTDYEIIDTWYAMGMSGDRQQGHRREGAVRAGTPRARARAHAAAALTHPGAALNIGRAVRHPDHRRAGIRSRPPRSAPPKAPTSIFVAAMAKRAGTYTGAKVADFQAVQIKLARARVPDRFRSRASRAMPRSRCRTMSARGEMPDIATKLRWRAQSAFAVNQAREAVETLWSCYGAQGLYTRDPLQRHLRDVIAMNQHFSFNFDIAGAAFGLHALGGNYVNPAM